MSKTEIQLISPLRESNDNILIAACADLVPLQFDVRNILINSITSSYFAGNLTPQGRQLPSFAINSGFKQELFKRKLVLIATVSDIFNTLRSSTIIDTPQLYEKIIRRRSARIIHAGITYTFGNQKKKKEIEYDN